MKPLCFPHSCPLLEVKSKRQLCSLDALLKPLFNMNYKSQTPGIRPSYPAPMAIGEHEDAPPASDDDVVERLKAAAEVLESVVRDRSLLKSLPLEERTRLLTAAGDVHNPDVVQRRRFNKVVRREKKAARLERDESVLAETGIRVLRDKPVYTSPNVFPPAEFEQVEVEDDPEFREAIEPQHCYVCKQDYVELHHFYDQLCPPCGDFNFAQAHRDGRSAGRVALLTGGRVKIGYQAGIKLLRAGAQLIVTTRFPRDSAARYAQEPDFEEWGDRLEIFGLDLRHTPSVEAFCTHLLSTRDRLDFIVNNACQTVRRPADFYRHMMDAGAGVGRHRCPRDVRALLGEYEGLRRTEMLPAAPGVPAVELVAELSQVRSCRRTSPRRATSSRRAASTRTCSRSICATGTPGACCSTRCRRSSCWRRSSSTPSRRSSSTRA